MPGEDAGARDLQGGLGGPAHLRGGAGWGGARPLPDATPLRPGLRRRPRVRRRGLDRRLHVRLPLPGLDPAIRRQAHPATARLLRRPRRRKQLPLQLGPSSSSFSSSRSSVSPSSPPPALPQIPVILKEKDHGEGQSEAHVPSGERVSQGIHVSPHPNDREESDLKGTAAKQGKDEEKSAEEDSHEPKASNIHEETMGPHEPENERTSSGDYSASSNHGGQRENEEPNVTRNRFNQAQPPSEPEVMTERATTEESNLTGNRYGQDRDLIESDGSSKNGPEESSLHGNKYSQTIEHAKPVSRIPPSGNVSQVASTTRPTTTPAATHPTANASMTTVAKDGPTSVRKNPPELKEPTPGPFGLMDLANLPAGSSPVHVRAQPLPHSHSHLVQDDEVSGDSDQEIEPIRAFDLVKRKHKHPTEKKPNSRPLMVTNGKRFRPVASHGFLALPSAQVTSTRAPEEFELTQTPGDIAIDEVFEETNLTGSRFHQGTGDNAPSDETIVTDIVTEETDLTGSKYRQAPDNSTISTTEDTDLTGTRYHQDNANHSWVNSPEVENSSRGQEEDGDGGSPLTGNKFDQGTKLPESTTTSSTTTATTQATTVKTWQPPDDLKLVNDEKKHHETLGRKSTSSFLYGNARRVEAMQEEMKKGEEAKRDEATRKEANESWLQKNRVDLEEETTRTMTTTTTSEKREGQGKAVGRIEESKTRSRMSDPEVKDRNYGDEENVARNPDEDLPADDSEGDVDIPSVTKSQKDKAKKEPSEARKESREEVKPLAEKQPNRPIEVHTPRAAPTRMEAFAQDKPEAVDISEIPYLAVAVTRLNRTRGKNLRCTGAILNEYHVLSAAHCFFENGEVVLPSRVTIVTAQTGSDVHQLDAHAQTRVAEDISVYPGYTPNASPGYDTVTNDLAVIKVRKPFVFNELCQPISLRTTRVPEREALTCLAPGWTFVDSASQPFFGHHLARMKLTVGLGNTCPCLNWVHPEGLMCSMQDTAYSLCDEDMGGPLVCSGKLVALAHGLASSNCSETPVPMNEGQCGRQRKLTVYVYLCPYLGWLAGYVPELQELDDLPCGDPLEDTAPLHTAHALALPLIVWALLKLN
ncbi:uncharacterized protein [Bemisia tabaci]|uniref:uncharacterized protein isoform X2 n=1 Tax=Bemisia tabaci TaxID=7038 RepID=UPI003B27B3CA